MAKTKKQSEKKILKKALDFELTVDEISKKLDMLPVNLMRMNMIEDALTTGLLSVDLISGGGYIPGCLITVRGETGTGKSSLLYSSIRNSTAWGVPVFFLDYEGSTNGKLLENIIGKPLEEIMGIKDKKGNYIVEPLMRYITPAVGEPGFRYINRILKSLPNKVEIEGEWYLEYESDWKKEIISRGLEHIRKDGRYYVKTEKGSPQAIFFLDSYASMLPERLEEDDESNPMAQRARMFSEYLPMLKSKLTPKRVTVIASNQMRLKPMAMFEDPRYEPGGQAIGFYPDMVYDLKPVSASTIKEGKGKVIREDCWDGRGEDVYKFSRIKTEKNKKFAPYRDTVLKIWVESAGVPKGGFCPVYDCRQYLRMTGQIEEGKANTLSIPGVWTQCQLTDLEFKALILSPDKYALFKEWGLKDPEVSELRKVLKKTKGEKEKKKISAKIRQLVNEKMDIVGACRKQLLSGQAFELYSATIAGDLEKQEVKNKTSKSNDSGSTDFDDDDEDDE